MRFYLLPRETWDKNCVSTYYE